MSAITSHIQELEEAFDDVESLTINLDVHSEHFGAHD